MILIGKKIKELRNKHKYTQTELATLVGVTKSTIAAYENDTRLPSYDVLIKLSRVLKVSTDYILLNKKPTGLDISALNDEQKGAISSLVDYYINLKPENEHVSNIIETH